MNGCQVFGQRDTLGRIRSRPFLSSFGILSRVGDVRRFPLSNGVRLPDRNGTDRGRIRVTTSATGSRAPETGSSPAVCPPVRRRSLLLPRRAAPDALTHADQTVGPAELPLVDSREPGGSCGPGRHRRVLPVAARAARRQSTSMNWGAFSGIGSPVREGPRRPVLRQRRVPHVVGNGDLAHRLGNEHHDHVGRSSGHSSSAC